MNAAADSRAVHQQLTLTTLTGWRQFVAEPVSAPQLLADQVWRQLDDDKRVSYDEDRITHHSRLVVVQTPIVSGVINRGRRLVLMNRTAHYGRCGLIVSGPARTGKTTAITQLGKTVEAIDRRRYGTSGRIPVVYITVPPAATPKMIAVEFARFLGLPATPRANITDVIEAVCGVCADAATSLVVIDEIHNLNIHTRVGGEASDTLKYFAERLAATFVFAGITVERAGLLTGTRGEQIAGRHTMIRTSPFGRDEHWAALIAALEQSLRLHRHRPGSLPTLADYLHQRTHGMIGSLLWLVRSAAMQAVTDGTEKITKKMLAQIETDIAVDLATGPAPR